MFQPSTPELLQNPQQLATTTAPVRLGGQKGIDMQYFEISYYRTRNWIDKRYSKSEIGVTDAIRKSRVTSPLEVTEITEAEYLEYSAKRKEREARRKEHANRFISA